MATQDPLEMFFKEVERPIIALGVDYPDGQVIPPHHHRRDQLLYGASGVVMVTTPQGAWVMPPQRGTWIPAGVAHSVRMLGPARTHNPYFEPGAVAGMPSHCQVVGISSFMRSLLRKP
jgi:hypothetical protein